MPRYGVWLKMPGTDSYAHVCGSKPFPTCRCGCYGVYLCDYPVGPRGKTCDAEICGECAEEVGEDKHYCGEHRGEAVHGELL